MTLLAQTACKYPAAFWLWHMAAFFGLPDPWLSQIPKRPSAKKAGPQHLALRSRTKISQAKTPFTLEFWGDLGVKKHISQQCDMMQHGSFYCIME